MEATLPLKAALPVARVDMMAFARRGETIGYFGRSVSIDPGRGLAWRNAYMSANSESDTTLSVYGGICPRGDRM